MTLSRRHVLSLAVATPVAVAATQPASATATPRSRPTGATTRAALTNLSHLDFLRARVAVTATAAHTTYRLAAEPTVGVLWTYAEPTGDGSYRRLGGGTYDPATDTYGQGAYNADDIARAAVVYLRHWRLTGRTTSRAAARGLLRGLTYLQTVAGPNAGNVVLWMQPDGTLNPSAIPVEQPDPSDSDDSYWLARTLWALGEGYAAFAGTDPSFAAFLAGRIDLAVRALYRDVLHRYGSYQIVDGVRVPAWLIVNGADASAEAVLGLAAYVAVRDDALARRALRQLAEGVAAMSAGDGRTWPFGAVLPWALSRSVWHAWASQMPAALARAGSVLGDPGLVAPAVRDSGTFLPWLLTSGGPDNGRLPLPIDRAQIAYGIDSRVQSLMATAAVADRPVFTVLAGMVAAWYFGANASGQPAYDPNTGRTVDGVAPDGGVNRNAGAESTIHGLLSMLVLDEHPTVAAIARMSTVLQRVGGLAVEAESGGLTGDATIVTPDSAWTGEAQFSGGGYVSLGDGARLTVSVPESGQSRLVMPVVDLQPGAGAIATVSSGGQRLGAVRAGAVGPQGVSPAPGALLPVTLTHWLAPGQRALVTSVRSPRGDRLSLDAMWVEPRVSAYALSGRGSAIAVLRTADHRTVRTEIPLPPTVDGPGPTWVVVVDEHGRVGQVTRSDSRSVPVVIEPGGFTLLYRGPVPDPAMLS